MVAVSESVTNIAITSPNDEKGFYKNQLFSRTQSKWHKIITLGIFLCFVVFIAIGLVVFYSGDRTDLSNLFASRTESPRSVDVIETETKRPLVIIPRAEWGARNSTAPLAALKGPVLYVALEKATDENCTQASECEAILRQIQEGQMERFGDLSYNFVIGGTWEVYEGRGWSQLGQSHKGPRANTLVIGFIGTGDSAVQKGALGQLLACGVRKGLIKKNFTVVKAERVMAVEVLEVHDELLDWNAH